MRMLCLTFVVFFSVEAYSQVSGYMGKKWMASMDTYFFAAVFTSNHKNNSLIDFPGPANIELGSIVLHPQVTAEYLFHNNVSIGLSSSLIATGSARAVPNDPLQIPSIDYTVEKSVLKGFAVGPTLRFYRYSKTNLLPPMGVYHKLSYQLVSLNSYTTFDSKTPLSENSHIYHFFNYGYGFNSMVMENFIIRFGGEIGIGASTYKLFKLYYGSVNAPGSMNNFEATEHFNDMAIQGYYIFNFNLGVSYLF